MPIGDQSFCEPCDIRRLENEKDKITMSCYLNFFVYI